MLTILLLIVLSDKLLETCADKTKFQKEGKYMKKIKWFSKITCVALSVLVLTGICANVSAMDPPPAAAAAPPVAPDIALETTIRSHVVLSFFYNKYLDTNTSLAVRIWRIRKRLRQAPPEDRDIFAGRIVRALLVGFPAGFRITVDNAVFNMNIFYDTLTEHFSGPVLAARDIEQLELGIRAAVMHSLVASVSPNAILLAENMHITTQPVPNQ